MTVTPSNISPELRARLQHLYGACWNTDDDFDVDEPYRAIKEYHRSLGTSHWYLPFHPRLSKDVFLTEMDAYQAAAPTATGELTKLSSRVRELEEREAWMRAALEEAERLLSLNSAASASVSLIREVLNTSRAEPKSGNIQLNLRTIAVAVGPDHAGGVVPLSIKRASNEEEANVWATSDGRAVYYSREWAEKADYMKTDKYRDEIEQYRKARNLVAAKVVDRDDYDGWVTASGDEDDYAADIDELLERHRDRLWGDVSEEDIPSHLPAWVYCCNEDHFEFDIEDAIRCYLDDNHHEDAADWIKDWDGLNKFWTEWSAKQKDLRSQMIDHSRIIVIDKARYEVELERARKVMEACR
jgi:hypothetical protein